MADNETDETMYEGDVARQVKDVLDTERLVTARLVDAVLRTSQMAGLATPEMRDMFDQWLNLVANQVLYEVEENMRKKEACDISALARSIGVGETTLFSLMTFLHRSGRIRIEKVSILPGQGKNAEACDCLLRQA
ncbi:MAG: hypothetical protein LBR61_00895 [Synergistaceae bacterium]|jgi:hypothetical protein|nr:hypothetical protein [Synergistaceae bacterium]